MSKITVMVVDDHPLLREGLIKILSLDDSIEVVGEAGDGETSITMAEALRPQVILMDINLPGMNGIVACQKLKQELPETQIIILTVCEEERQVLEVVRAGANGYLLKDVEPEMLIQSIKDAVMGRAPLDPKIAGTVLNQFSRMSKMLEGEKNPVLTEREKEIMVLMAKGTTNRQIAESLFISEKTVKNHVTNIFRKLEVGGRTEAVVEAMKRQII
ncbi:MAG: response regulator transcription factor [Bacillota bacterium]